VSAQPLAFRSDNAGADDFSNTCGSIVTDPNGRIQEVGIVARPLTNGRAAQRRLFRSLNAG
jgi:hypothetical protein